MSKLCVFCVPASMSSRGILLKRLELQSGLRRGLGMQTGVSAYGLTILPRLVRNLNLDSVRL